MERFVLWFGLVVSLLVVVVALAAKIRRWWRYPRFTNDPSRVWQLDELPLGRKMVQQKFIDRNARICLVYFKDDTSKTLFQAELSRAGYFPLVDEGKTFTLKRDIRMHGSSELYVGVYTQETTYDMGYVT